MAIALAPMFSPLTAPPAAPPSLERRLKARIEAALTAALKRATGPGCPPRLADAMRAAVFPGGARLRPQLCLLAAFGSGDAHPALADAAACAIELLHCASLVHDDLPCFDDADTRRGQPTIHRTFGQPLAVLVGDALIVLAFETLAAAAATAPGAAADLLTRLAISAGPTRGIVAGQAWESEPAIPLDDYHRAKTGALFEAAVTMGAIAGGGQPAAWQRLGDRLGRAYQAADDLQDLIGSAPDLGKPTGQDGAHGRPNLASVRGPAAATARLRDLLTEAAGAIPDCRGKMVVRAWVDQLARRLLSFRGA
jgi:geranylgeranyl diphosphate synthase, type II